MKNPNNIKLPKGSGLKFHSKSAPSHRQHLVGYKREGTEYKYVTKIILTDGTEFFAAAPQLYYKSLSNECTQTRKRSYDTFWEKRDAALYVDKKFIEWGAEPVNILKRVKKS